MWNFRSARFSGSVRFQQSAEEAEAHVDLHVHHCRRALFSSEEAPEDEATLGALSLNKAPFVAGQLHLCLQHTHVYTPVLVGFNPTHHAKSESIPGCTFTFHSVVQRMQELAQTHEAFVINPAVAPEAVSGSSRMKGGSATKILLDVVLSAAHAAVFTDSSITHEVPVFFSNSGIVQRINAYKKAVEVTYAHSDGITALLEAAGQSLQCGRCVCYLGWGSVAVLGLIDATECEPTFGADHKDVRSFISGGYSQLDNSEGHMSSLGRQFNITHEDFLRDVLPHLNNLDTVLLLYTHCDDVSDVVEVTRRMREKTSNIHAVYHHHHHRHHHHHHH
uniref:glucokinase regulatory protein isoform X1 n=1 Tax=Solea senegalensis TaxID=28829 RepID=UPI001CD8C54E|nr:glucokinase regulatory protein isoform X1 [Solea senegalensis]XP_043872692.1 glucokinase regulatory protein isoform X1 [Solea senegalensis]XP_043872693.1 glucokinase regulatory protein isoform X1 [Solea senegalensis]